ncbi:MAG: hypothetical protein R3F20_06490 [Planctomycetota bacterium]
MTTGPDSADLRREEEARAMRARAVAEEEFRLDPQRLIEARREADLLWPVDPVHIDALHAWRSKYGPLIGRRAEHERALERLRARGRKVVAADGNETWDFGGKEELRAQHEALATFVADLIDFSEGPTSVAQSVAERLALSAAIRPATIDNHRLAWRAARTRIAGHPFYGGYELAPQLGLIPLGPDPVSGLEEFLHLLARGPDPRARCRRAASSSPRSWAS